MLFKKIYLLFGTGEVAPQLRTLVVLPEDLSQSPAPMSTGSKQSVTPAPDLAPSSGLSPSLICTYLTTDTNKTETQLKKLYVDACFACIFICALRACLGPMEAKKEHQII